ncbi:hypothetical protein [Nannocystis punicea]|uniref:Uncharacterized protein n=1 Tax=Nannocystis punicea TaxID=2995304 RepID=A0ABY7HBS5_9BACT|nr:hypothetical protein [Nannocystis poenicansa]WAS96712.1 hypothetical protein O0S08_11225 [Nannocystis poenicansa]
MRLRILEPCRENWDTMEPTEVGRRCEACSREVHDLTGLTARQAKRLLTRAGPRPCVRVRADEDGLAVFRREPPRLAPAAAAMALAACAPHTPEAQRLAPAVEVEPAAPPRPSPVIPEAARRPDATAEPGPPKPVKAPAKKPERERVLMGDPWD